jgi:nucleoside-diphosphate-sugar epimerase
MFITQAKPVLLTGAAGFLGRAILAEFQKRGIPTQTLGRSANNDIICDLTRTAPIISKPPSLVIHAAGKAHSVPRTQGEIREFFNVNVKGTSHLVKGLQEAGPLPDAIVFISSVSVYGLMRGKNIREDHPLSSRDPYGISKVKAENILLSWCEKNKVSLTILRLPLIAGPQPPGNLGAMIRGIQKGYYLNIAGGTARKSMVMASDVAAIIPTAANHPGIYHLTDGHHPSIKELSDCIAAQLGVRPPRNISLPIARALGRVGDAINLLLPGKAPISTRTIAKLTASLTFDDATARKTLGWNPHRVIDAFTIH